MFNEYPDVVEINGLQEILHIGRSKAYELLRNGTIKHIKIGRIYKIPKKCIVDYIINCLNVSNELDICYNCVDFKSELPSAKE